MNTICRLCLQKDESITKVNIFDLSLSDTLYWIFGVEIDVGDCYSKLICSKCLYIVKYVLRIQKQFQTNQYILRERICPVDFDVEAANGTRDMGTSTEYQPSGDRITISINALAKINRPFVPIEKFEDSEIHNYYTKISQCSYRQKKHKEWIKAVPDVAKTERISVPLDIFSTFPSLQLPKLENTYSREGYEKINDYLYKELPKHSQTSAEDRHQNDRVKYFETHELPNDVQVSTEGKGQLEETEMNNETTHDSDCDMISVPTSIFNLFNSPYVDVPKLDNALYEKGYKKIDEFVYREMPTTSRARRVKKGNLKNKLYYKNYYYNLPTSALKELMMERQQVINGERNFDVFKNCRDKHVSLIEINKEVSVEVCKHCSQNFKNEELLKIHCNAKHNKSKVFPKIVMRRKKSAPKKVLKVDPLFPLDDNSSRNCAINIRPKMSSAHKVVKRMHFKKIKKLPSLFEKMNLGKMVGIGSKDAHFKKKWMASNHPTSENITVSENCSTSENYETSKHNSENNVPTETYVYQQQEVIWFPEVVGSEAPYENENSDFLNSDNETDRCVNKQSKNGDYVISLRNKLSSRLKANGQECTTLSVKEPVDEKTANFIKQRLGDVKKTREELEYMKKLLDGLRNEIIQGSIYHEKCDSIMNLLSVNKTV